MYNRYIGNTGKRCRVPEASDRRERGAAAVRERSSAPGAKHPEAPRPHVPALPFGLDTGDLMLLLLLFFLYTESGDEDFIIILAVVSLNMITDRQKRPPAE